MQDATLDTFRLSLSAECARLGLPLSDTLLGLLALHYELLVNWNRRIRLVGSVNPERAASELYADSLAACAFADSFLGTDAAPEMIDIGAGAGFPGIPLKAARPERPLALVEANEKKVSFLKYSIGRLGLRDVSVARARAEVLAHEPAWRERYDLAFCRAVAHPAAALELAAPFLRVGGSFILQAAGPGGRSGLSLERAAGALGIKIGESMTYTLSGPRLPRLLVRALKVNPTPVDYPRPGSVIQKRPLG